MGDSLAFRLYGTGVNIDNIIYNCLFFVSEEPPYLEADPPPEDGEEYFIFTVKYVYFDTIGRPVTLSLFREQSVVARNEFYASAATILSDIVSRMPWQLPENLLGPAGPWMSSSARAAVETDFPNFQAFRTARVLSLEMNIVGPYHDGGDVMVDEYESDDDEVDGDEAGEHGGVSMASIEALLESLEIDDGTDDRVRANNKDVVDTTCSICLDDLVKSSDNGSVGEGRDGDSDEIVRMPCSHTFHKRCVMLWLETKASCPYCRYAFANLI